VQTAVMPRILLLLLFFMDLNVVLAQQVATTAGSSKTVKAPAAALPADTAKLVETIRGSYYHPDTMSTLDCDVSVDWPAFFSSLKTELPADRMKTIQGLKIRARASRGKITDLTFDWSGGPLDNKDQFENGLKQMIGGFYQIYWNVVSSSLIGTAAELNKIEPMPDGGTKVYTSSSNMSLIITVDKSDTPTHFVLDSPALKGKIDARYLPSPNPTPGDLRRISGMDLTEQIGTSTINLGLGLDYQTVDEFYVPRHVSFDISGAYSLKMELSSCSASREKTVSETK
jgi:hypothetical protein